MIPMSSGKNNAGDSTLGYRGNVSVQGKSMVCHRPLRPGAPPPNPECLPHQGGRQQQRRGCHADPHRLGSGLSSGTRFLIGILCKLKATVKGALSPRPQIHSTGQRSKPPEPCLLPLPEPHMPRVHIPDSGSGVGVRSVTPTTMAA